MTMTKTNPLLLRADDLIAEYMGRVASQEAHVAKLHREHCSPALALQLLCILQRTLQLAVHTRECLLRELDIASASEVSNAEKYTV